MQSLLDSNAVFQARMSSAGLTPADILRLEAQDITSLGKLAFSCSCTPGSGSDQPFVDLMTDILVATGSPPLTAGKVSALRRVWFEAHTVSVAEVKHKVEQTEDSKPRRIPVPERAARARAQQNRLVGLVIAGSMEPSHSLIDYCHNLKEQDTLQYIDPAKCTSRESELSGTKRENFMVAKSDGTLKSQQITTEKPADLNTEYRVRLALQRRSLALDQTDLMTYEISEEYHSFLFALMMTPVPSSHLPLDTAQILRADRQIYHKMAETTRSGISKNLSGVYPLHDALRNARNDPIVSAMLQPLPKSSSRAENPGKGSSKMQRPAPYAKGSESGGKSKDSSKGKSKGKGKGKNKAFSRMPQALVGCHSTDKEGKPICYDANLSGCDKAELGKECSKGRHICCYCYGLHSFNDCTKWSAKE